MLSVRLIEKIIDFVAEGNNATDKADKEVAKSTSAVMAPVVSIHVTLDDIVAMQNRAPPNESFSGKSAVPWLMRMACGDRMRV